MNSYFLNFFSLFDYPAEVSNGRKNEPQKRQNHAGDADDERRPQADPFAEAARDQRAAHHHSHIDETKTGGHPALQMIRRDRLAEAHQIYAVELHSEGMEKV